MGLVKAEAARKLEIRFPFYVKTPSFRVDLTGTKFSKKEILKEKTQSIYRQHNSQCNYAQYFSQARYKNTKKSK